MKSSLGKMFSFAEMIKWCCFLFLFFGFRGYAQTITVGASTFTSTTIPIASNVTYSYSQQIYLSSEGTASLISAQNNKYITAVYVYWAGSGTITNSNNWTIYLGNTTLSSYASTSSWITTSNLTPVYSGIVSLPAMAGWLTITLTTPFLYTGNNIVLGIDENSTGLSTSPAAWRYSSTSATYRCIYVNSSVNPNPAAPPIGIRTYSRPNAQFYFYNPPSPTGITCSQDTICTGASSTLTMSGGSGTTYWFNGSCGSSITSSIGNGTTITVNPTTTTTYYCRNYLNGMWSANCVSSTLYVSSLPATPTNPTSNSPFCGSVTLSAAAPPVGNLWYWQTSPSGTSISNSGNTNNVNVSGTYYLRACNSAGCWSTNSSSITVTVLPVPAAPTIPLTNSPQCDSVTLTRATIPPVGVQWYWQGTNPNGNSTLNNSLTYSVNTSGTYYISALNSQGCWNITPSPVPVIVYGHPQTPPTPISNSPQCDSVTITWFNAPPQGVQCYWQTNPVGVLMNNSAATLYSNLSGTFYLRARNSGGCWSSGSSSISVNVTGYPFPPNIPLTTSPSCDSVILTMSGIPPNNVNWYWQGNQSNGASMVNTNISSTVFASGTYYIRARNYANCWSVNSTPISVIVNPQSYSVIQSAACDEFVAPDGQIYNTSGQYNAVLSNYLGCDSNIVINLQVDSSYNVWNTITACNSYTWIDGNTYNLSNNNATYTFTSLHGCDSTIHLNLNLGNTPDTVQINAAAINLYSFNGIEYNQNGTYYQLFTTQYGCDSVIMLNLVFEHTGLQVLNNSLQIFPNPNIEGVFTINTEYDFDDFFVTDLTGKLIPYHILENKIYFDSTVNGLFLGHFKYKDVYSVIRILIVR